MEIEVFIFFINIERFKKQIVQFGHFDQLVTLSKLARTFAWTFA